MGPQQGVVAVVAAAEAGHTPASEPHVPGARAYAWEADGPKKATAETDQKQALASDVARDPEAPFSVPASDVAVDPNQAPFFSTPVLALGSQVRGLTVGKEYMNENAVRARAGLLHATAWTVLLLELVLPYRGLNSFDVIKWIAALALWEMVSAAAFGLTPLAPYGMLGTLITMPKVPHWKPAPPKRFAWVLGAGLVTCCLLTGLLDRLKYLRIALAGICAILTGLEGSAGFCVGCWMYGLLSKYFGKGEKCPDC